MYRYAHHGMMKAACDATYEKKSKQVSFFASYLIKNEKRCQESLFSPFFFVSLPYKTNNSHNLWEKVKKVAKE